MLLLEELISAIFLLLLILICLLIQMIISTELVEQVEQGRKEPLYPL